MKRNCAWLFTLVLFLSSGFVLNSAGDEAEKEVLRIDDARIKARADADVQTMSTIYSDDYTLITAEGDVRKKILQIGELRSGKLQFRPSEILERTVHVYDNTAIVLSRERSVIIRNGKDIDGDFRCTGRILRHRNVTPVASSFVMSIPLIFWMMSARACRIQTESD